jgi:hypothetical protein
VEHLTVLGLQELVIGGTGYYLTLKPWYGIIIDDAAPLYETMGVNFPAAP